mgnify:CR=1 FL=1
MSEMQKHIILQEEVILTDTIPKGYKSCKDDWMVKITQWITAKPTSSYYSDASIPMEPGCFYSFILKKQSDRYNRSERFARTLEEIRQKIWEEIR